MQKSIRCGECLEKRAGQSGIALPYHKIKILSMVDFY